MTANQDLNSPLIYFGNNHQFLDFFNLEEVQRLQDLFAKANGVASIITYPDGTPITKPSNFTRFGSDFIMGKDLEECLHNFNADKQIGKINSKGAYIKLCLGGGLWVASSCITVGHKHLGNWIIGQVRNEKDNEEQIIQYAPTIGVTKEEFLKAFLEVPEMSVDQFTKVSDLLFVFAGELADKAYQRLELKMQIAEKGKIIERLKANEQSIKLNFKNSTVNTKLLEITSNPIPIEETTDRTNAEKTLRQSEEKYRYLFANNPQPMWIYDLKTLAFLEVNDAAIHHYGYSKEEFFGMTLQDIRPAEDIPLLIDTVRRATTFQNSSRAWRHKKKNGEIIFVEISSHSVIFNGQDARHILINDITERKQALEALASSESSYRRLFESSKDGILILDAETGIITDVNPFLIKLLGYSEDHYLGKAIWKIGFFIGIIGSHDHFFELRQKEDFRIDDIPIEKADGQKINVEFVSYPYLVNKRKVFQCNFRDITERKRTEESLRESHQIIEGIINSIPIRVFWKDKNLVYLGCNELFASDAGLIHPKEIIGKNDFQLGWHKQAKMYRDGDRKVIESGQPKLLVEEPQTTPNGKIITLLTSKVPLLNDKGKINGVIGTYFDISDRKHSESELIIAKEKAEESDRLKSAFLANMSHEVRTPLNSIIGFSELLADGSFDGNQKKEFIQHIINSGNNLLNIISDVMDISRMESGEFKIHRTPINAVTFISGLKDQFAFQVAAKKIGLKLTFPAIGEETFISADAYRLSQIFNNLISNALKFTQEGQIEIGFHLNGPMVEFYVRDSGIGIPEPYQDKIFERFRQVENEKTRKYGGNGLGLAISKNLVELMGGKIRVESEPGKGSVFYFTLPTLSEKN